MKYLVLLAVLLFGVCSGLSLNKGALQPRFAEVRNWPMPSQDFQAGEDEEEAVEHGHPPGSVGDRHTDDKYTPGMRCHDATTCVECGTAHNKALERNGICLWLPRDTHANPVMSDGSPGPKQLVGECLESRQPEAQAGEVLFECNKVHSSEVTDTDDAEEDDYSELHVNGDPNDVDIAFLKNAEPVYTTANELGAGEGPEAEAAGDWLHAGMDHAEYEGHIAPEKRVAHNYKHAYHNDGYGDNGYVKSRGDASYNKVTTEAP